MKTFKKNQNPGFVALFTVLLASVILAMAVGIANIALKQIVLSASATDANKSFYAADSGIECALYQDFKGIPPNSFDPSLGASQFNCGGHSIDAFQTLTGYFPPFEIPFGESDELCAVVTVDKTIVPTTRIISKGLNVPCGTTSSRMVERVIQVTY